MFNTKIIFDSSPFLKNQNQINKSAKCEAMYTVLGTIPCHWYWTILKIKSRNRWVNSKFGMVCAEIYSYSFFKLSFTKYACIRIFWEIINKNK